MTTKYKVTFDHDPDPDFSWLEQDIYNPDSPNYEPIYRSKEDRDAGRDPLDGHWYRDPDNHVCLTMCVYELGDDDADWKLVDSLGGIDFLADSDDWTTGTFYSLKSIAENCTYQRELFEKAKFGV